MQRSLLARAFGLLALTFAAAFALQLATYAHGGVVHTLGDVPKVFVHRGVRWNHPPYFDRMVEYPVVTGAVIWIATIFGHTPGTFMLAIGAVNATLAGVVTLLFARVAPVRVLRWVTALPLVLYGVHNWDLVAIAPFVAGLVLFERGADRSAGALVAVGASAKLFPGAALLPLAATRWRTGDRNGARRFVVSAAAVTLALNVPVLALDERGWWAPFRYHGNRPDTWATPWFYLFRAPGFDVVNIRNPEIGTLLSLALLVVGLAVVTWCCRHAPIGTYAAAAASTAVFLLAAKIFSPGYDLWLVPFFVLLPLSAAHWRAFCAVDLGIYVTTYGMLQHALPRTAIAVLGVLVFVRVAIIAALLWRSLLPDPAIRGS